MRRSIDATGGTPKSFEVALLVVAVIIPAYDDRFALPQRVNNSAG